MPLQKKKDKYENPAKQKTDWSPNTVRATTEQLEGFRNAQKPRKQALVDEYQNRKRVDEYNKKQERDKKSSIMQGIRISYEKEMRKQGVLVNADPAIDKMTQQRFANTFAPAAPKETVDPLYQAALERTLGLDNGVTRSHNGTPGNHGGGASFGVNTTDQDILRYKNANAGTTFTHSAAGTSGNHGGGASFGDLSGLSAEEIAAMQNASFTDYATRAEIQAGSSAYNPVDWKSISENNKVLRNSSRIYEALNNPGADRDGFRDFVLDQMTPEEQETYRYLFNTKGPESAYEYYSYLNNQLKERAYNSDVEYASTFGAEHPFKASVKNVFAGPLKAAAGVETIVDYLKGEDDPYSNLKRTSASADAMLAASNEKMTNEVSLFAQRYALKAYGYSDDEILGLYSKLLNGEELSENEKRALNTAGNYSKAAGETTKFVHSGLVSAAQNAVNAAIGGAIGNAAGMYSSAAGATAEEAAKLSSKVAGKVVGAGMGASALGDTYQELRSRGVDSDRAMLLSVISGGLEMATEDISVEALLSPDSLRDGLLKYLAKNATAEAQEEFASSWGNFLANSAILGDEGDLKRAVREYMEKNPEMSEKEAAKQVWKDQLMESLYAAGQGAFSGAVLSGTSYGGQMSYYNSIGNQVRNAGNDTLMQVAQDAVNNAKFMQNNAETRSERKSADAESKRAESFMEKAKAEDDGKGKVSNVELGRQALINDDNLENTIMPNVVKEIIKSNEAEDAIQFAVADAADNGGATTDEVVLSLLENDKAREYISSATGKDFSALELKDAMSAVQDYLQDATKEYNEYRVAEKADAMGENGAKVLSANYKNSGIESANEYNKAFDAYYSYGAQLGPETNVVSNEIFDKAIESVGVDLNRDIAQRAVIAGFNDVKNGTIELGGANGKENSGSGSGRIYHLADGRQTESASGERGKIASGYASGRQRAARVKDVAAAQIGTRNGQKVSSLDLGIKHGTSSKRNVVLDAESIEQLGYTEKVKELERRTGAKVVLVTGVMEGEVATDDGVQKVTYRGMYDSDTNTLICQADNRNLEFDVLGLHEEFHSKFKDCTVEERERYIDDIMAKVAGHDEAEFQNLMNRYNDKYGWKNMGYSDAYIVEEILADAYAGIDVWSYLSTSLGAAKYTESVRKYADAIIPSKMYGEDGFAKMSTDDDFGMKAPLEETDRLIAIHNMRSSALQSMIDLGGLAMPSFAVKPAHIGHTTYGDISVVAGKRSIDPTIDREATIYGGDAWTPTFPEVHIKPNMKAFNAISKRMDKAFADEKLYKYGGLGTNTYRIALDDDNARDAMERWGSFEEAYGRNNMLKLMFLKETGRGVPITQMEKAYKNGYDSTVFNKVNGLIDVSKRYDYSTNQLENEYGKEINDILREFYLKKYDGKKLGLKIADTMAPEGGTASYNDIIDLLDVTSRYNYDRESGNSTQLDTSVVDESIRKAFEAKSVQEEYDSWLKELGKSTIEKKGIRNNKDMFTPSGNRRTFEQLHYDYTLDNIVKAMRSEAKQGRVQFMSGPGSVKGAALKSYNTIEEVRAERNRILNTLGDEGTAAYDEFHDATLEIAKKVNADDWLSGANDLADILGHAKTAGRILSYMKREYSYLNPSMSLARDIEALGQLANSLPMEYFEAKLYRAFPVSEALAYVVPDNLDATLKKNLQDAGGNVVEYKADDMDDRLEKINGVEGARFSEDEPVASKNVHGIIYGKEDAEFSYSERGKNYVEQIHNSGMLWAKAQNQEGTTSRASREYAGIVRRGLESRCVERVRRGVEKRTDSEGRLISDSNLKKLNGSVVLTDNYEYIPVYHATVEFFEKHLYGDIGFHYGDFSQAENRAIAKWDDGRVDEYRNPIYRRGYLSIKHPAVVLDDAAFWIPSKTAKLLFEYGYITEDEKNEIVSIAVPEEEYLNKRGKEADEAWKELYKFDSSVAIRELLKEKGFDGVIYANGYEEGSGGFNFSYMVLDDSQIILTDNSYLDEQIEKYDNHVQRNSQEDFSGGATAQRMSIDESFVDQVDEWNSNGRDNETVFTLGSTGNTLQALGAIENDIYMNSEKVNRILKDHPEMDIEIIKQIPKIVDDPTLILNSKNAVRNPTRVVMFSSVKDTKGIPVLTVLDLRPVENGFVVDDMQKLTSAYGKNVNAVDFVKNSEVLFVKEKRIASLLRTIGFTMPMELKDNNPYIGSISYKGQNVNIKGEAFGDVFTQVQRNSTEDSDGNSLSNQQQEYFKDSKVRDADGRLRVMYHGTENAGFTIFNPEYGTSAKAIFFTSEKGVAKSYSGTKDEYAPTNYKTAKQVQDAIQAEMGGDEEYTVKKENGMYVLYDDGEVADSFEDLNDVFNGWLDYSGYGGSSANYKSYLNVKNPYIVDGNGTNWDSLPEIDGNNTTNGYVEYAKKNGYDGVIFKNITDIGLYSSSSEKFTVSDVVAVFDSNQIKSVTNAAPTSDPDIRYSTEDADGNALSEQQQEYFRDSKVRDENGRLKVMYHGTSNSGFTVFEYGKMKFGLFGEGFYFTDDENVAEGYSEAGRGGAGTPGVYKTYLNITSPIDMDADADVDAWVNTLTDYFDETDEYVRSFVGESKFVGDGPEVKNYNMFEVLKDIMRDQMLTKYEAGEAAQDVIKAMGYDGITHVGGGRYNKYDENRHRVYIAFEQEQIKNIDNVEPTDDPDIRYSQESDDFAERTIREENDYLKGAYASLLTEVRTNKGSAAKMRTNANKVSDGIREAYESRIDKNDLRARINRLVQDYIIGGEQNEAMAYDNAKNEAVNIARDIINNAGRLKNADEYDRYLDLKKRLKNNDGIYLDPSLRGDPEKYQEIRKRLFGTMNIKNSGTALDTFYSGLVNDFGELFSAEAAPGIDQLQAIEEVLNTLAPIYENPYNGKIAEAIEICANDILMSLNNGSIIPDSQAQNARSQAKMEKIRQDSIDYARRAIAAERVHEQKRIDRALDYYKNRDLRKADNAEREKLRRIANRLNNRKLPAVTRALVEQYIGDLDLISVRLTNKRLENLKDLRLWYEDQQTNNPDFVKDPEIEKLLQRLSTRQISELNIEEVRWLTTCLQNIENELAIAKKTIDTEDQRDIHIQADESMNDIDHSKGNGNNAFTQGIDSFFVNGTLSPIRAVKRMVGYNTESPIFKRTVELEQGQIKSFDWQRKAEANFLRWTNDKKFMRSITGKNAELIDIGNGAKITPAMRMSLYLHSKNEQNMRHIIYGGITVPDMKRYKDGNMAKAYGKGAQTIKLNAKQVREIVAGMTEQEKAFADAAADYFNGMSQESINEVSEKLKGYSLALVQNYFPINTNSNFTLADYETVKMDGTIEGMGFLKERQNASNPIYLRDITDVLNKSISSTAKYVGLAIPVRNFNKIYNVSSSEFGDEAKAALEEMKNAKSLKERYAARDRMREARELFTGSMRESVMQNWDVEGIEYIENMMADVQNPRGSRSAWAKLFQNVRGNYAGSVLGLSASVAMKQAASYPTAAAVLGWKPLSQAFLDVHKIGKKFDMNLVNRYTPLLWHRASNFNVQYLGNVGTAVNQNKIQELLSSKALNWITDMDVATTRLLWFASEHYVQNENKALVKGSDAYYREVAEIYNRVITETQPNYTTMERPQLLRTDDTLLSSMMMFKTQSFQNFNVLYDAIGNRLAKGAALKVIDSEENRTALESAKKDLKRAALSQLVQTFVFAAMTAVCAAILGRNDKYKDDEGEVTMESLAKQVGKDMLSGAMSMVPFGGELYNVLARVLWNEKYYGFDNITASSLDDMFNAFIKAADSVKNGASALLKLKDAEGNVPEWNWNEQRINLDSVLNAVTKVYGIPYDNASKILEAAVQHVAKGKMGEYEGTYVYLRLTKKMSDTGAYYDNLFKAYQNDRNSYENLKGKMIADGFDEEKMRNAVNNRLKKAAGVASVSELDSKLVDPAYQDEYDAAISMLINSPEYQKLSTKEQAKRRSAVESTIKNSDKVAELAKAGLDAETYNLYTTARKLADVQGDNNGSYNKKEKEAAIKMLLNSKEITSAEAAKLRKYDK